MPVPFRTPAAEPPAASGRRSLASVAVLIPAWQPEARLLELVMELSHRGVGVIVVVDDGSGSGYQALFDKLATLKRVELLRHAVNRGKGRALKTGFDHLLNADPEIRGVVTADADGQHAAEDIERVARALLKSDGVPVLGVRGFEQDVPLRNRVGNQLTRHLFSLSTGARLAETQTGLRGLPRAVLPQLLSLAGERYEYEMTMLAHLCRAGQIPVQVPIATIYLDNNRGSHFNPIWDSLRIYRVLLRTALSSLLPWITGIWVFVQLLALRLPLLNRFFYDTLHADVQGIDFYSLPKAWLNLASGRSLYGTFDPPTFGPHFTWYLAHPLLAVVLGAPLSRLDPPDSYGLFTLLSLATMAACAFLLGRETEDAFHRRLIWLLLLGAFPTFEMLYVGNVQAFTVLGLSLLLIGMLRFVRQQGHAESFVLAGLLVSLFTKPVVLLTLPLLLLLPETRRAAFRALAVYVPVSLLFECVPVLNPQAIGLGRVLWLARHPRFVRETMNIYANHLVLTPDMRDNSIHWFNLVAQSGFRLPHVDVFSLSLFLDGLFGVRTPDWLYLLPTLAVLALSLVVPRIPDTSTRRQCALLLAMAASLDFFLSYPTVWEYQYTAVLPVAAVLLLLPASAPLPNGIRAWSLGLSACVWLPSLYCFSGSALPSMSLVTLVRLDRVVPVTLLFGLLLWTVSRATYRALSRTLINAPQRPSAALPMQDCSWQAETLA